MIGVADQGVFLRELKANFKEAMDALGHYFDDDESAKAIGRGNEESDSDLAGSDDERRPRSASPSKPSTRLTRSITAKTGMGNVLRDDTNDEESSVSAASSCCLLPTKSAPRRTKTIPNFATGGKIATYSSGFPQH